MTADARHVAAAALHPSRSGERWPGRVAPSAEGESERAAFRTRLGNASTSIRRTIANARQLSFPPQPMKLTTCQSRNHAAATATGHGKHTEWENRAKNVTASIRCTWRRNVTKQTGSVAMDDLRHLARRRMGLAVAIALVGRQRAPEINGK